MSQMSTSGRIFTLLRRRRSSIGTPPCFMLWRKRSPVVDEIAVDSLFPCAVFVRVPSFQFIAEMIAARFGDLIR